VIISLRTYDLLSAGEVGKAGKIALFGTYSARQNRSTGARQGCGTIDETSTGSPGLTAPPTVKMREFSTLPLTGATVSRRTAMSTACFSRSCASISFWRSSLSSWR
jgi:hypothetical protein